MDNDLISRSALLKDREYCDCPSCEDGGDCGFCYIPVEAVKNAPAVDASTLRPTGRWEEKDERFAYYGRLVSCSECGVLLETHKKQYFKYCYNCGAKMEG